jgi:hypothetical protein
MDETKKAAQRLFGNQALTVKQNNICVTTRADRRRIRVESVQSVGNPTSTDNPEPLARNNIRK